AATRVYPSTACRVCDMVMHYDPLSSFNSPQLAYRCPDLVACQMHQDYATNEIVEVFGGKRQVAKVTRYERDARSSHISRHGIRYVAGNHLTVVKFHQGDTVPSVATTNIED